MPSSPWFHSLVLWVFFAASSGVVAEAQDRPAPSGGHIKTVWVIVLEKQNWSAIKGSKFAPCVNPTLLPESSIPAGLQSSSYSSQLA
jgi:hypothetical protein